MKKQIDSKIGTMLDLTFKVDQRAYKARLHEFGEKYAIHI